MAKTLTVGGEEYRITPPKAFKVAVLGSILSDASQQVRELLKQAAAFRAEYRDTNSLRITRQDVSDWKAAAETAAKLAAAAEDGDDKERHLAEQLVFAGRAETWGGQLEGRDYVELPRDPSDEEVAVAVMPFAFKSLDELTQVIGLVLMPESDLKAAWKQDDVHDRLRSYGQDVLEQAEMDELVDVAVAVAEVVKDRLDPMREGLRRLQALYSRQKTTTPAEETPEESETQTGSSPTSSTPSEPQATDGQTPNESDSTSPGASSEPSPPASEKTATPS